MPWHSWIDDGTCTVADLDHSPADGSSLAVHARIPLPAAHRGLAVVDDHVVVQDGDGIVYATQDVVQRLDSSGAIVWSRDLGRRTQGGLARSNLAQSRDGTVVWVYAADAMAGRAQDDRLMALACDTGDLLATGMLESCGHAAGMLPHPDGSLLIHVAQGQDGGVAYLARLEGDVLVISEETGEVDGDRVPCGFTTDGTRLLTCEYHGPDDLAVHEWPSGAVLASFPAEELRPDLHRSEDVFFEYGAAFLDDHRILAALTGEDDSDDANVDGEWTTWLAIDVATGSATNVEIEKLPAVAMATTVTPLGDGTWIAVEPGRGDGSERLIRRRFRLDGIL